MHILVESDSIFSFLNRFSCENREVFGQRFGCYCADIYSLE